jgi:type IV secretion system protein VirB11
VAIRSIESEAISRGARMLRTAFGPAIARFLDDPDIVEVMLNPDGRLWIDRLSKPPISPGSAFAAMVITEKIIARGRT